MKDVANDGEKNQIFKLYFESFFSVLIAILVLVTSSMLALTVVLFIGNGSSSGSKMDVSSTGIFNVDSDPERSSMAQIWNQTWGMEQTEQGFSVWADDSFVCTVGETFSFPNPFVGTSDIFLIKWDSNGNRIWNKTWGGSQYEYGEDIVGLGNYLY
ncbi:MAG: hypothetical protein ACTSWN_12175, partial [Promethearchaeota archaeon]